MIILINNKLIQENEAKINILSDAVMYGYGIFETLRTYPERKFLKLDAHINRLISSAKKIELKLDFNFVKIQQMVKMVAEQSDYELQRIKIIAFPEYLIIISKELIIDKKIYNGVSLKTVNHNRGLPQIKSTSYLDCVLHYNNAVKHGFYDALFIDNQKFVYECARSNIYWVKDNILYTRQNQVLPGITRKIINEISHSPIEYNNEELSKITHADEIFITNSIIGIVPVIKIDDAYISDGKPGKTTQYLIKIMEKQSS